MGCEARQMLMLQEATTGPLLGLEEQKKETIWESNPWGQQSKLKVRLPGRTGTMEGGLCGGSTTDGGNEGVTDTTRDVP